MVRQLGRLICDSLEDVVDKRVHNAHGLGGDARVGMHLLEHLIDVDSVGLLALLVTFLRAVGFGAALSWLDGLFGSFGRCLGRHGAFFKLFCVGKDFLIS